MEFTIPPRPTDAMQGSAFAGSILHMPPGAARDEKIFNEYARGNVPDFLRAPVEMHFASNGRALVIGVMPDYLAIGTDDDFFRTPVTPIIGQRIADIFGGSFPTRHVVNMVWLSSVVQLAPDRLGPPFDEIMQSSEWFVEHNGLIEKRRRARSLYQGELGELTAGHKKDVVLTSLLLTHPHAVAIYGWHDLEDDGKPIQGLNVTSHGSGYADYSHGLRLVTNEVRVDGHPVTYGALLASEWHMLVSDEGPISFSRQPSVPLRA